VDTTRRHLLRHSRDHKGFFLLSGSMQGGGFRIVTPVLRACELGSAQPVRSSARLKAPRGRRLRYHPRITTDPDIHSSSSEPPEAADDRVGALRGAGVAPVNVRRLGQALVGLSLVALLAVAVVFFAAGAHKNNQIDDLKRHGVPVTITVTGCLGLAAGSGSNVAGYSCHGRFTLDGQKYDEPIPGTTLYPDGAQLHGVAVPGDPALVTTSRALATESTSNSVYVVPAVLTAVLVVAVGLILVLWRRRSRRSRSQRS